MEYFVAVAIEYLIVLNVIFFNMCIMIIAVGPCLLLTSMTQDIEYHMDALNKCARIKKNRYELIQQFNKLIQFHSNAKQLSKSNFLQSLHPRLGSNQFNDFVG